VVKVVSRTPCSAVSEEDYGYIRGRKRRVMAIEVPNPMRLGSVEEINLSCILLHNDWRHIGLP